MAKSVNQVFLMGNLTRDPELRSTQSGTSVCSFAIAINRSWTGSDGQTQEDVDFFDIVAWGKLGELVDQYMSKGRRVMVQGRLSTSSWEAKDGSKRSRVEVVAQDVTFLDGASDSGGSGSSRSDSSNSDSSSSDSNTKPKQSNKDSKSKSSDSDNKPVDLSDIPF
jgi:single-strand DNA-binding protein